MAGGVHAVGAASHAEARPSAGVRTPTAGEIAWIAAVPCALVTLAVVLLLGPPLGELLFGGPYERTFWPAQPNVHPEPTELARYQLSVLYPLLIAGCVAAHRRRPRLELAPGTIALLVRVAQALAAAAFVVCLAVQRTLRFGERFYGEERSVVYFTVPTLVAAAALTALLVAALARPGWWERLSGLARDTPGRRRGAWIAAIALVLAWALTAINTDATIVNAHYAASGFVLWSLQETYAVLNGRTTLVDYHSLYSQLWPYLSAGAMVAFGKTLLVYTTFMAAMTCLALVAAYDVFRRATRSALVSLALFAPFVATGFFAFLGSMDNRYAPSNVFSLFPIRYGSGYLVLWLAARHIDGARPRRLWPLALAAGLVLLNNADFGIATFAATTVALLWSGSVASWAAARRALAEAAAGLLGAVALVTLWTVARSGELPHFDYLVEFARMFSVGGFDLLRMPLVGFHDVLYLTYVGAFAFATVRAVTMRGEGALLTGMLAASAAFGFGAASRYVGESHPEGLITAFSAWGFSLSLLVAATVQAIARRPGRRASVAEVAVLFAFGLSVCSLAQTPTPWSQVARLVDNPPVEEPRQFYARLFWGEPSVAEAFVDSVTERGETVLILTSIGSRIADHLGLRNVSPYATIENMPTREQLDLAVRALRREGGTRLILKISWDEQIRELERIGFQVTHEQPLGGFLALVDTRAG